MGSRVGLVVGALAIGAAFGAGVAWVGSEWRGEGVEPSSLQRPRDAVAIVPTAVTKNEDDVEQSKADLSPPTLTDSYAPDPEIRRGERQVAELIELSCKQDGTNCELAKLSRRQYREKYGL